MPVYSENFEMYFLMEVNVYLSVDFTSTGQILCLFVMMAEVLVD